MLHQKRFTQTLLACFLLVFCGACQQSGLVTPAPIVVLDEVCQGILGYTFVSYVATELGQTEQGNVIGYPTVGFLSDGRVVWKYSLEAHSGTFECTNGVISASFSEGDRKAFEGIYDPEKDTLFIDEINYYKTANE